jgi:hypothetical protein
MVECVFVSRNTLRKTKSADSEVVACHKELVVGQSCAKSGSRFLGCWHRPCRSLQPIVINNLIMSETTDGGGFITSPESSYIPPTPASTATTLASPPAQPPSTRPISSREESLLISNLDDQILTISSRFTRRSLPKLVQF